MLPAMPPRNAQPPPSLAARIGRWSTRHRRTAIIGWLAFVLAALFVGSAVGTASPSGDGSQHGASKTGDAIVDKAYPDRADETVLVQAGGTSKLRVTSPEFRAAVDDVVSGVSKQPGVIEVQSPYGKGNQGQLSKDGRSALV